MIVSSELLSLFIRFAPLRCLQFIYYTPRHRGRSITIYYHLFLCIMMTQRTIIREIIDQRHRPMNPQRSYWLRELALLYYPSITADQASRNLRRVIYGDSLLMHELQEIGWQRFHRKLSPSQVLKIAEILGTPEEYREVLDLCRRR